ncbi:hemagglutinin repeat-containing protein [Mycetohabitans sp. B8]|uniref:two-partner secretion domain-containing protein n=1 Tax=Mycetohabitans sp. B8 TaxID=2841845 RepID=UPI001F416011|nr:hemagglutinin repeat-containing protein [Mycetohabitans sp. B8]MCG1042468.1 hemagglutinin repeat-containing protein [Mycetohabitans sp. B8]
MNSHLYQVVFNRARGLQMAVAEHVASQGKQRGVRAARSACPLLATMRVLDFSILLSLGLVVDLAQAQIVADPGAPRDQQPTVLNAANGVPLINIQAPSAGGVSRNTYSQFDVGHRGVILNNASTHTQTQLGGWVQGNPWLVNGTARVILNEINASHPSQLRGYMEVAGERAQVVVANPAGISCAGCGFINANRVTLTTGAPIMNGGNLDGYRVQQGAVTLTGGGLDASRADYTDIIARSVRINAGLWVQQLRVITGANQVSASQSVVDSMATDSNVPAFALDVSQLGGMYAQKIVLLGTEHGVGMRNAGQIGASAGELVVTVDGRLENSGALQARTDTHLNVGSGVANSGTISAGRELVLDTPKDLDNRGGALHATRLEVNADSVTNRGGTMEQTGAQDLVVHAAQVRNREGGHIGQAGADADAATMPTHDRTSGMNVSDDSDAAPLAAGALNVTHILDNDGGSIMATGAIDLTARAGLDNEGGHLGVRNLNVKGGDLVNRLGELYVTGSPQLQLGALQNETGQMQLAGPLTLNAQSFDNRAGQLVVVGGDNRLEVKNELDNSRGGQIVSDGALHIRASTLNNAQGRVRQAGVGRLQIEVPQLEGVGGTLVSDGALTLMSHKADLRGGLTQGKQIRVDTDTLTTAEGVLRDSGAGMLELKVRDVLDNNRGAIRGNGALTLQTQQLINEWGRISAAGTHDTQVDIADQLNNTHGQLVAAGNTTVRASDLRNQGGMIKTKGQSNLDVSVDGTLDNRAQGTLAADGDLRVTASTVDNRRGKLIGVHGLRVESTTLDNREDGWVNATEGSLKVSSQGQTHNAGGTLQAASELTLDNTGLDNADGVIRGSQVKLDTRQATLNNTGGALMSTAGRLDVRSGALDNTGGLLQSAGAMRVQTHGQTVRNIDSGKTGGILSGGELDLNSGELHNRAGVVHSQGQLTAHVGALDNTKGQFGGSAEVGLEADSLRNRRGVIQAGQALQMGVADVADNEGGLVAASGKLSLNAKRIHNHDTRSTDPAMPLGLQGDAVALTAKHIDNHVGTIAANRRVKITGVGTDSVLDNTQGNVSSAGSIQVFADRVANPAGTLLSGTDCRVEADSLSGAGHLLSKGNLNLALRQDFDNDHEVMANGHAVVRTGGQLTNRGVLQAGELEVHGAQIDNTVGGRINGDHVGVATDGKLSNRGLIDATQARIKAGAVDNVGSGRLSGDQLTLQANFIDNQQEDGQAAVIAARTRLDIGASRLSGAGRLLSNGDLNLALQQDFDNDHEVIANGRAVIRTMGRLVNRGTFQADELEVRGAQIDNTVGGRINGNRVRVATDGKLSNHGLIDGVQARVEAGVVDNVGTGRFYGDHLALQANTVDNRQEDGRAAVIAARARLDIGANVVNNHEQALIFSAGHDSTALNIGGALSEQGQAVGRAGHVLNDSATIESLGGLSFNTQHLLNRNAHFATELVQISGPTQSIALQPAGDPNKHDINDYHWAAGHKSGCYFHNGTGAEISNWTQYDITRTEYETRVTQSTPALIRSGGNLVLQGENFTNDKSHIFVGGALQGDLGNLKNEAVFGQHITREAGTSQYTWNEWRGGTKRRHDRHWEARIAYTPADIVHTIELPVSKVEQHTASGARGYAIEQQQLSQADDALKASAMIEVPAALSARAPELGQVDVAISGQDSLISGPDSAISGQEPTSGQNEQGVLDTHGDAPMVIRTVQPSAQVPANSLFRVQPNHGSYLIETDPRFADYRTWQSAATLLSQGKQNPAATHKRLGDGFYEQMLVREQVAQLTGRRFLKGYASDDAQYQALLEAGSAYAKAWNLRPGVALSTQQMAQLTRDIVWLVEQDVHLPDGTVTRALVPQVYARVKPGDLDGNGTLLAAEAIDMRLKEDLVNTGTLAGHTAVQLNAENLRNVGGRITGKTVSAQALGDIDVIGGSIDADQALFVQAGRDLNVITTTRSDAKQAGQSDFSRTHLDRIAGLSVNYPLGGPLVASAGRDVNLIAAQIANNGQNGQTTLIAGRDLNLGTVKVTEQERNVIDASNDLKQGIEQEVGTTVHARGNVRMQAGGDLNARAARVNSDQGALVALAEGDVNIVSGQTSRHWSEGRQYKSRNLFGSSQTTTRDSLADTTTQASTFGGHTVAVQGRNVTLIGSNVVSDKGTFIEAQNDLTIQAATQTYSESHFKETKKSGLLHNGGMSLTIGSQAHSADQQQAGTRATASTVGSTNGNVTLVAKQRYRQEGSHILTPRGDVEIQAGKAIITEAREQSQGTQQTQFKQSGLTVAVTAPAIAAVQTAQQVEQSVGQTSDPRMQALAGVTTGLAAKNTADAIAQDPKSGGGVNISVTVGGAQSGSQATYNSVTASGSSIAAGGNVRVRAVGSGQDSTLTVQGSKIQGGGDIQLKADGKINLLAAQNTRESHLTHSSHSGGVGVAVNLGSQDKAAGVTASVSGARGWGEGTDVNWTSTHVSAGNRLVLESGGDTTLKGAVLSGRQVIGEVGGDLSLESLQGRSSERSRDISLGGSVTAGLGVSGSVSFSQQKMASDWASVTERSGIQAGDGGFQINVKGHTSLKGAAIASTQQAVHDGANSLTTRTLSTEDIVNYAEYKARSVGLSGGYSLGGSGGGEALEGVGTNQSGQAATGAEQVPGSKLPSTPGGFSVAPPSVMAASGKASSTTLSGISAGAIRMTDEAQQKALTGQDVAQSLAGLNQQVWSGQDGDNALKPILDKEKIQAGFEIANQLTHQIGAFVGHRQAQLDEAQQAALDSKLSPQARAQAQQQAAQLKAQWGPGGTYRRALSALGAAAGGNVTAGAGQFALSATVHYVQGLAASEVKRVADGLQSEEARAALHALVGCAGAAASGQDCGAGAMGAAASSMLGTLLGPTQGLTQRQQEAQTNLVSSLVAAVAGMAGQDTPTATTAAVTEGRFNRQINDNEKRAIAEKAGSNKGKQERLAKAACYAVRCWAEYKPGSEEYTKYHVSQLEASQLQPEIDWVNQQKEVGLFEYTPGHKIGDAVKSDPVGVVKDVAKVVVGGVTAKTGLGFCTTGFGCTAGIPMAAFGLSDMIEGSEGLYNRYNGINTPGVNPLRYGVNQLNPTWGDTVYDGLNLAASIMALRVPVPLKMGVADGLNRPGSMFDVSVPRINNNALIPFVNQVAPYGTTQGILLFGVGSKGVTVIDDIRHSGDKK